MIHRKSSTELRLMRDPYEYPEIRKPLISNDTIVHLHESTLVSILLSSFTSHKARNYYYPHPELLSDLSQG